LPTGSGSISSRTSTGTCSWIRSILPIYFSIECKSILAKKLYFSRHFPADQDKVRQVDAVSHFLTKTGRIGYLALEFRNGPGKAGEAFLIPWPLVTAHYAANKGITIEDARASIVLAGSKDGYLIESLNAK
jgi:hypothetical protein